MRRLRVVGGERAGALVVRAVGELWLYLIGHASQKVLVAEKDHRTEHPLRSKLLIVRKEKLSIDGERILCVLRDVGGAI